MGISRKMSLALLFSFFTVVVSGCGHHRSRHVEEPAVMTGLISGAYDKTYKTSQYPPIVNKPITLKVWTPYVLQAVVKSNRIMASNIEMEKRTGIKIEWIEPPPGHAAESFNLMIASGNLPDIIEDINGAQTNDYSYPGGYDKAIEDGVIRKLNNLIDLYAPNYKRIINSNPTIKKLAVTDKGNIFGMAQISADIDHKKNKISPAANNPGNGLVIRRDWLDELGLKLPVTIDDWHTVLVAFKQKKHVKAPLLINKTGIGLNSEFLTAFGTAYTNRTGQEFYQQNGKVMFGPIEPGFKAYLTLMNKWYQEGLIDTAFALRNIDLDSVAASYLPVDQAGASDLGFGYVGDYYFKDIKTAKDPTFYLQPVNPPVLKKGDKIHFRYTTWSVGGFTAVTTACKNPVAAIKWLDYQYSEEGIMLDNWGRNGITYTIRNGKPVFTDLILKAEDPKGADLLYVKSNLMSTPGIMDLGLVDELTKKSQKGAVEYWGTVDNSWVIPPLYLTQSEESTYTPIINDIKSYINEMTVKFILGVEPLSKFDVFVNQIKSMGIDKVIKIKQNALNRYNGR